MSATTVLDWGLGLAQGMLVLAMALAAWRMLRGPRAQDRILGLDTLYLNGMLAGIAPADARPLQVEGVSPDDVRAWRMGNETYLRLRSPSTLLSPPWNATERGEGDVQIYAFPSTPVVLLTVNGRTVSATLKD